MNRFYLIAPCVLMGGFGIYHHRDHASRQKIEATRAAEVAAAKSADEMKKAALKREADERAQRLAEERAAQERARVEKKRRDFEDVMQQLAGETAIQAGEVEKLARESGELERRIVAMRASKERAERDVFDLAKAVEEGRVQRRNAELEIQRTARMVATRLQASDWANGVGPRVR